MKGNQTLEKKCVSNKLGLSPVARTLHSWTREQLVGFASLGCKSFWVLGRDSPLTWSLGHTGSQCPLGLGNPGLWGGVSFFQRTGSVPAGPLTTSHLSSYEGAVCELP